MFCRISLSPPCRHDVNMAIWLTKFSGTKVGWFSIRLRSFSTIWDKTHECYILYFGTGVSLDIKYRVNQWNIVCRFQIWLVPAVFHNILLGLYHISPKNMFVMVLGGRTCAFVGRNHIFKVLFYFEIKRKRLRCTLRWSSPEKACLTYRPTFNAGA